MYVGESATRLTNATQLTISIDALPPAIALLCVGNITR